MAPLVATRAVLDASDLCYVESHGTQLESTALAESASWLHSALSQLRELERDGTLIPGVGDFRIPQIVGNRTRLLLSEVAILDVPVPMLRPFSGGGVSVSWEVGNREVRFAVYPDVITFCKEQDDTSLEDGIITPRDLREAAALLQWLVNAA